MKACKNMSLNTAKVKEDRQSLPDGDSELFKWKGYSQSRGLEEKLCNINSASLS